MNASSNYEPGDPADEPQLIVVRDSDYSGFRVEFSGEFYADTAEIAEIFRQEYALSIANSVHGAELARLRAEIKRLGGGAGGHGAAGLEGPKQAVGDHLG